MRVLFLTHRLPYAPNRGDRVRAYHLLRHLSSHFEVDVLSLVHDEEEAGHRGDLTGIVSSVSIARVRRLPNLLRSMLALPTSTPMTHTLLDSGDLAPAVATILARQPPDVVLAYCSGLAWLACRPPLRDVPCVLDIVDVDSVKWCALAEKTSGPRAWVYRREARVLARFEAAFARHVFATLTTTGAERELLRVLAPDARIEVVQNGVDVDHLRPLDPPAASTTVVFCGVMNYRPNEEAVQYLVSRVWPMVRQRRPDAHLQIVGSSPTAAVRRLADADAGIEVTGAVADVRPYLWRAAVAAAPLLTARGIQNKVLEAVAAGLPTVVTPPVFAGLPAEVHPAVTTADTPEAVTDAIVGLLALSPVERRAIAGRAALDRLSWDERLRGVPDLIQRAAATGSPGRERESA